MEGRDEHNYKDFEGLDAQLAFCGCLHPFINDEANSSDLGSATQERRRIEYLEEQRKSLNDIRLMVNRR